MIAAIKSIDLSLISILKKDGLKAALEHIDFFFLVKLISGMVIGIVLGVFGISYLIEHYPEPLWSFFFGLILASCVYIMRQVEGIGFKEVFLVIIGFILSWFICEISPVDGSTSLVFLFFAGMVAISALILPGISGSFILLILGLYTVVIGTLKNFLSSPDLDSFKILFVFGLGCLCGLAVFSRVLSWTFKHYEKPTLAVLVGFMLGSLNKIWPWRIPDQLLNKETGTIEQFSSSIHTGILASDEFKILTELKVLPSEYLINTPKTTLCIISFFLGLIFVFGLSAMGKKTD